MIFEIRFLCKSSFLFTYDHHASEQQPLFLQTKQLSLFSLTCTYVRTYAHFCVWMGVRCDILCSSSSPLEQDRDIRQLDKKVFTMTRGKWNNSKKISPFQIDEMHFSTALLDAGKMQNLSPVLTS